MARACARPSKVTRLQCARKIFYDWLLMFARALWTSFLFADGASFVEDVLCVRQRLQVFHEAVEDLEDFA